MRNKKAKAIKEQVAVALYGKEVWESSSREDKKAAYDSPEFKSIYRARKKNEQTKKRFNFV